MEEAKGEVKHVLLAKFKDGVSEEQIEQLIKDYVNLVNLIEPIKGFQWYPLFLSSIPLVSLLLPSHLQKQSFNLDNGETDPSCYPAWSCYNPSPPPPGALQLLICRSTSIFYSANQERNLFCQSVYLYYSPSGVACDWISGARM